LLWFIGVVSKDTKKPLQHEFQGLFEIGAGNEARTRDLNLGKVALYQLSYSRVECLIPKL
jgi:hypothetical protein